MAIGKLHLLVLHFPLALIIVAAFADVLWLWRRKDIYRHAGHFCILLGAISAIAAVVTGALLIAAKNYTGEHADIGETHESLGIVTMTVALVAAGLRVWTRNNLSGLWGYIYGALIVGSVTLVSLAGHYGGMLAFGKNYLSGIFGG